MTDGLAILAAWLELAVLVGVLAFFVLRRTSSDPLRDVRNRPGESDDEATTGET